MKPEGIGAVLATQGGVHMPFRDSARKEAGVSGETARFEDGARTRRVWRVEGEAALVPPFGLGARMCTSRAVLGD